MVSFLGGLYGTSHLPFLGAATVVQCVAFHDIYKLHYTIGLTFNLAVLTHCYYFYYFIYLLFYLLLLFYLASGPALNIVDSSQ